MQLIAPVTDYIPASILTTHGDLVERGAVIPERLAGGLANLYLKSQGVGATPLYQLLRLRDTGLFIKFGTRNAGGIEAITGVGFQPSLIIPIAVDTTETNLGFSIGFDIVSDHACLHGKDSLTEITISNTRSLYVHRDVNNYLRADLQSLDADGFTWDWNLVGACSISYEVLCIP